MGYRRFGLRGGAGAMGRRRATCTAVLTVGLVTVLAACSGADDVLQVRATDPPSSAASSAAPSTATTTRTGSGATSPAGSATDSATGSITGSATGSSAATSAPTATATA